VGFPQGLSGVLLFLPPEAIGLLGQ
jgi:hypothetical protein